MNTNGISRTHNAYAAALSSSSAALSPGAIMLLLQRRMRDMDGQVDSLMREIESNTERSEYFAKRSEAASLLHAAVISAKPNGTDGVALEDIEVPWEDGTIGALELIELLDLHDLPIANSVPHADLTIEEAVVRRDNVQRQLDRLLPAASSFAISAARNALEGELDKLDKRIARGDSPIHGTDTVSGNALQSYLQTLQSQARRMNSNNEVLMVQMQSAMQQRSQVVTMATQMLKSINDSAQAIAQNIGR